MWWMSIVSSNAVASPNDTRTRETLHLRGGGNGNGGTTREEVRPTNIRMAQAATTTIAPTPAGGTLAPSPWVLDATLTSSVVPTVIHPVVGDAMNTDTLFPTPQLTTIAPTLALVQRGPVVSPRAPHQTIVLAPPTQPASTDRQRQRLSFCKDGVADKRDHAIYPGEGGCVCVVVGRSCVSSVGVIN